MLSTKIQGPDSAAPAPLLPGATLHGVFSARARQFPERTAVSDEHQALSYAQLDAVSSRLATRLRREGVQDGMLVGMCVERGVELVIALLGILKAGAAYVPIDPLYPCKRVEHIVRDSGISRVICSRGVDNVSASDSLSLLRLDDLLAGDQDDAPQAIDSTAATAPAYVIYTSGSTGEPKGVLVAHGNVLRLLESTQPLYAFDHTDVWSMFHSIGFDFSVWEIWGALAYGGHVAVVPYALSRSPEAFHAWLADQGVTVLSQTPSAFRGLDEADRQAKTALALRYLVFGGEALPATLLRHWVERHGDAQPALINMYGITEGTVHTTYKRVTGADLETSAMVSIGTPLQGTRLHLLDANRLAVADGEAGELYIEGPGVACGYLNRPELSAERFVVLPGNSARAYKTGDLMQLGADGEYRYVGRSDDQLKIRGFRIEPGEIEACLLSSAALSACHVGAHDYGQGDWRLIAYVVPTQGPSAWNDQLRAQLASKASQNLPDYMRPSAYIALAALPLTAHGKIDKRELPSPASVTAAAEQPEAALCPEERQVLKVWGDELGLTGIGLHDDFFDFGGTSLTLIHSLAKLKTHYGISLNPGVLAEGATAKVLADNIRHLLAQAH